MLNPSKADAENDDHTIRRCMDFVKSWGYGQLFVVNLFAYRATDPMDLYLADDPFGSGNHEAVVNAVQKADEVICAWGNHGHYLGQNITVLEWMEDLGVKPKCLEKTKVGQPAHPARLKKNLVPIDYQK